MVGKEVQEGQIVGERVPWLPEEDKALVEYVQQHGHDQSAGIIRWNDVARGARLNRNGKSCRLRWMNYLKPGIKKEPFTEEEKNIILKLQEQYPNKWVTIARYLPGRTEVGIKNFCYTHKKKNKKKRKENNVTEVGSASGIATNTSLEELLVSAKSLICTGRTALIRAWDDVMRKLSPSHPGTSFTRTTTTAPDGQYGYGFHPTNQEEEDELQQLMTSLPAGSFTWNPDGHGGRPSSSKPIPTCPGGASFTAPGGQYGYGFHPTNQEEEEELQPLMTSLPAGSFTWNPDGHGGRPSSSKPIPTCPQEAAHPNSISSTATYNVDGGTEIVVDNETSDRFFCTDALLYFD